MQDEDMVIEFEFHGDISNFSDDELLEIMNTALEYSASKGFRYDPETGELFILDDDIVEVAVPRNIIQWAKEKGDTEMSPNFV